MAELLSKASWAIVGSHGRNPICDKLFDTLTRGGKRVFRVNPAMPTPAPGMLTSLKAIGQPIDVVDLVINPAKGVEVVHEMGALGIRNLWIQPGASSPEVLEAANKYGMNVHQGCVLVEARW